MTVNKDEIREYMRMWGSPDNPLTEHVNALLASDDAKEETIRQQAEEIERCEGALAYAVRRQLEAEQQRDHWLSKAGANGKFYMDALKENTALREFLAWYADASKYSDDFPEEALTEIDHDKGFLARQKLAELDRKDTQPKRCDHCPPEGPECYCHVNKPVVDTQGEGGRT